MSRGEKIRFSCSTKMPCLVWRAVRRALAVRGCVITVGQLYLFCPFYEGDSVRSVASHATRHMSISTLVWLVPGRKSVHNTMKPTTAHTAFLWLLTFTILTFKGSLCGTCGGQCGTERGAFSVSIPVSALFHFLLLVVGWTDSGSVRGPSYAETRSHQTPIK